MKEYTIKDSGKRQEFETGSRRDLQDGKGRYDLLPPDAVHALAVHFEKGAKKYGCHNWAKGQPVSRYMSSALRHTFKYMGGQTDEDHLVAAAWNLIVALATRERCENGTLPKELLDIPDETLKLKTK